MNNQISKQVQMPEVFESISELENAIFEIENSQQSIKERLNPIIGGPSSPTPEEKPKDSKYTCDLAMRIEGLKGRVLAIQHSNNILLNRIQL